MNLGINFLDLPFGRLRFSVDKYAFVPDSEKAFQVIVFYLPGIFESLDSLRWRHVHL